MLRRKLFLSLTISLVTLFAVSGCMHTPISMKSPYKPLGELESGTIMHVSTGTNVSEEELINLLSSARVVYVGEAHTSINHHEVQLKIIKALAKKYPGELAVGMEMFRRPSQPILDRWISGEAENKEFFMAWYNDWGLDFRYYRDILIFLKDNQIPLLALNVPRRTIPGHKTAHEKEIDKKTDAESLSEASKLDIDSSDPYHRANTQAVFGDPSHTGMNFDKFYTSQLVWEETMAETVAKYLKSEKGRSKRMVVLAGGGHINYGFGIPKRVFRRLAQPYMTVMPISVDLLQGENAADKKGAKMLDVAMPDIPLYISDFVWGTDYKTYTDGPPLLGVFLNIAQGGVVSVTSVSPNSGAEKGGIVEGDIISEMDGDRIDGIVAIKFFLSAKKNGDTITVTILRGGAEIDLDVTLIPLK